MSKPAKDRLGEMIDKIDNLVGALQLPLRSETHVKALRESLPPLSTELKRIYAEIFKENPWEA